MEARTLFPALKDPLTRNQVLKALLAVDYPILSLYTLFRDIRHLEPAAQLLKALIPPLLNRNVTLRQSLRSHFLESDPSTLQIQQTEHTYITVIGAHQDLFEVALRQLWLCSLRSVSVTVSNAPKRDMDPVRRTANSPSYFSWVKLVKLAHRLGFSSLEIRNVLDGNRVREIIESDCALFLLKMGNFEEEHIKGLTQYILTITESVVNQSTRATGDVPMPYITVPGEGVPLKGRCGVSAANHRDMVGRHEFFFDRVHAPLSEYRNSGGGLSLFFIRRCIYLSFLGPTTISEIAKSGITEILAASSVPECGQSDSEVVMLQ